MSSSQMWKNFLPEAPLPRPRAPQFFRKKSNKCGFLTTIYTYLKLWDMCFINHNLHVKRRGDFGTFCLVLPCASRELNLSRSCLTCFCLILVCAAHCYSIFEKQVTWFINHNLQIVVYKPQSLIFFVQISNFEGSGRGTFGKKILQICDDLMQIGICLSIGISLGIGVYKLKYSHIYFNVYMLIIMFVCRIKTVGKHQRVA